MSKPAASMKKISKTYLNMSILLRSRLLQNSLKTPKLSPLDILETSDKIKEQR